MNFVFVGNSKQNNKGTDKKETLAARIERKQEERRKNKDQQNPEENTPGTKHDIAWILERRVGMGFSNNEGEDGRENDSGNVSDDDWETDPNPVGQASSGSQSLNKKRSESPDSGHGSDTTSPSHPVPKAGKPLISPKPADLHTRSKAPPAAQVNNVDPVNSEVQDPSTLSVNDRIARFDEKRWKGQTSHLYAKPKTGTNSLS